MLKLFNIVTLRNDDPEAGIKAGTEGTIVDVLGKCLYKKYFHEWAETINPRVINLIMRDSILSIEVN